MEKELPTYRCHKLVKAARITAIAEIENAARSGVTATLSDGCGEVILPESYVQKHRPYVGGYYVIYDDGYKSFSPAKAFEEGYALIGDLSQGIGAAVGMVRSRHS